MRHLILAATFKAVFKRENFGKHQLRHLRRRCAKTAGDLFTKETLCMYVKNVLTLADAKEIAAAAEAEALKNNWR